MLFPLRVPLADVLKSAPAPLSCGAPSKDAAVGTAKGLLAAAGLAPRGRREAMSKHGLDLMMTDQKASLIEPLASEPAGDLRLAFAGVTRRASRDDIGQGVSPTSGDR